MATVDLSIRQNDTLPGLTATITDATGTPIDLTGATVRFVMRTLTALNPTVTAAATVVTPAVGAVAYAWQPADTATPGLYMGEFHVTLPTAGGTYTWPHQGYLSITVEQSLLTPAGNELVTVADAKRYLRIPSTDHSEDANVLRFIRMARPLVESVTGPIIPQQFEEWHDGGQTYVRLWHPPNTGLGTTPLLTVQAISEYNGPIEWPLALVASPDKGQLYSAQVTVRMGRVVRRTAGGAVQPFPGMPQSVHVWYVSGQQSVPDNVYEATLELLRTNFQPTQQQAGVRAGTGLGLGSDDEMPKTAYLGFFMSGRVREMLAPNKRFPSLA